MFNVHLGVGISRTPTGGHTGDHLQGDEGTVRLVDDGQSPHGVLVQKVGQERMVGEKTGHPGLSHSALAHIEVTEVWTPAVLIFN